MFFWLSILSVAWVPAILGQAQGIVGYISDRSGADARVAEWAERASARVADIHAANRRLAQLRLRCRAGGQLNPATHAALAASGLAIAAAQAVEQNALEALLDQASGQGTVMPAMPFREPPGPCELPGTLRLNLSGLPIVSYREAHAGFDLGAPGPYSRPEWHYAHPGVQPL